MKAIYISDELHRRAKIQATEADVSLKELIEHWVDQGLHATPSHRPEQLTKIGEPVAVYELQPPSTLTGAVEALDETFIDEMEQRGVLTRGERLRQQFQAEHLALRKLLGITTPPAAEPPTIEEVRAIFRHQRELHPEVPSLTELLRQMREEE